MTAFIGGQSNPSTRLTRGVSLGSGFLIIGFEGEYAQASGDDDCPLVPGTTCAPSVRTIMFNGLVQTPRGIIPGAQLYVTIGGGYFRVQNAQLYSLPESLPPVRVAAGGAKMAGIAARISDGMISTAPDRELIDAFRDGGGSGPLIGQMTVCWAESEERARKTALEWWPQAALHGEVSQELPNPSQFTDLAKSVTEDQVAEAILCSPDPERHLERIKEYTDAGYTHVYVHQVGPDQDGFIDFASRELLARVGRSAEPALA